ncbi:MAG: phytoene desaturase [Natronohydrobacter sp.]|nr:phytoene desaturase [Natronohydrobacter sp.]
MAREKDSVLVIGAGIGGLAAAIRLAARGLPVTLVEAQGWPGGKMRTTDSRAGTVDAGPTVLTLRAVLDDLFAEAGTTLAEHLSLTPLPVIARHYWADGAQLDLFSDPRASADAIGQGFGMQARDEFMHFDAATRALYDAFAGPIMLSGRPSALGAASAALARPALLRWLRPGLTLDAMLARQFTDPRLRQLFARYATYVGGNPQLAPALLALIWQAEARGVWAVKGGMAQLAQTLAGLFTRLGGVLRLNTPVTRLLTAQGRITGAELGGGAVIAASQVVFNGDPAALPWLLDAPRRAPKPRQTRPRSLSAHVWTFAAQVRPEGLGQDALAYHTVFFADDAKAEFAPLARGQVPHDPTIYVCAQDRSAAMPQGPERFQFILNAPAVTTGAPRPKDIPCPTSPCTRLARFGLYLDPEQDSVTLTGPTDFAALFPHSQGALYGLSPNSPLATFLRPTARTRVKGLYLAGGGVHPGAGVPMAALSGKHAAEAVLSDRISAVMSRPMAMPGGISTGSATTGRALSR